MQKIISIQLSYLPEDNSARIDPRRGRCLLIISTSMATISLRQQAEIENVWRAGGLCGDAQVAAGVCEMTAQKYFRAFAFNNVPRGRRRPNRHKNRWDPPLPLYDGPVLIGKRMPPDIDTRNFLRESQRAAARALT
jgi:hypothetical protein